ncbi:Hsp20/alpha crystallin family protein [Planctomycetales bacterium ZRK34]|nr:Hsp20/alpha crystallin family protein [Planctomycetales bacterium ZRK34]
MLPTIRRRSGLRNIWSDPYETMHREFDTMLNRLWSNGGESDELIGAYPVDIREDEDHIYVEAEMPGFKKDEVDVTLEAGVLTIIGQRKLEETKGEKHLTERRFTRVQRSFSLPSSVDEAKVEASLADGVLHVTLNKREEVKPRKITVK